METQSNKNISPQKQGSAKDEHVQIAGLDGSSPENNKKWYLKAMG